MPELPEVETTRRGIEPHLLNHQIQSIVISQPKLRWPIPDSIKGLEGARISSLQRRGKYILMYTDRSHMIWHLGMSGSMRILPAEQLAGAHEHVRLDFDHGVSLRYRDPRRFGALLLSDDPMLHPLIATLGPEPLSDHFNTEYLWQQCRKRSAAIKQVIMDSHVVVGVGNIYACESLFASQINPNTRASRISKARLERLVLSIKQVLSDAIEAGGTTLRDFTRSDGKPGYFRQSLQVYGSDGVCPKCQHPVKRIVQAQRSTFYCSHCQH